MTFCNHLGWQELCVKFSIFLHCGNVEQSPKTFYNYLQWGTWEEGHSLGLFLKHGKMLQAAAEHATCYWLWAICMFWESPMVVVTMNTRVSTSSRQSSATSPVTVKAATTALVFSRSPPTRVLQFWSYRYTLIFKIFRNNAHLGHFLVQSATN